MRLPPSFDIDDFGADAAAALAGERSETRSVPARRTHYREGETTAEFALVVAGWAFRFKLLPDGRRQILSFVLPGDALAPRALWIDRLDCSVQSLTELELRVFDRQALIERMRIDAALAMSLGEAIAHELAMTENRLISLGQRTALERVARLVLVLHARLRQLNMAQGDSFAFPLRQQHIADALGMTPVHVSRVFSELKAMNLVRRIGDTIAILDHVGLLDAAGP